MKLDFMDAYVFADCAAQVFADTQKNYRTSFKYLGMNSVRALRVVSRSHLSTVGCRVAVWRGKDSEYVKALNLRLSAVEKRRFRSLLSSIS